MQTFVSIQTCFQNVVDFGVYDDGSPEICTKTTISYTPEFFFSSKKRDFFFNPDSPLRPCRRPHLCNSTSHFTYSVHVHKHSSSKLVHQCFLRVPFRTLDVVVWLHRLGLAGKGTTLCTLLGPLIVRTTIRQTKQGSKKTAPLVSLI